MAYTAVPTYTTNQLITAAHGNTYWRDNINQLWPFTTAGDIAYASSASALTRRGIGSNGYALFSNGSAPIWDQIQRAVQWRVLPYDADLTTGNGKDFFFCPPVLNGYNLVDADAAVDTVSSSGLPNIMLRKVYGSDILSTAITIDAGEHSSFTAVTPSVINTGNDHVATGTIIAVDVDGAGTGAKGLVVILVFELP